MAGTKMFQWGNPDNPSRKISQLQDDIEDLKHNHSLELNRRQRQHENELDEHRRIINDYESQIAEQDDYHQSKLTRQQEAHDIALDRIRQDHKDTVSQLESKVKGLEEVGATHAKNIRDRVFLTADQNTFEAERIAFGDVKTAVLKAREEGAANAAAEYKKGYADGLSDGLREGIGHTKGDRDALVAMANKVVDNFEYPETPDLPAPQIVVVGGQANKAEQKK